MADPRLQMAVELRAAGLVERADALLAELVQEQTGARPFQEISNAVDENLAKLRSALGMKPRRRRAKNPRPTVQQRLTALLADAGVLELDAWSRSQGYWLQDEQDVMRWECRAKRWGEQVSRGEGFHVGSWSSMSDCVRYGITVVDGEKHGGGYCAISVEAKYPRKIKP